MMSPTIVLAVQPDVRRSFFSDTQIEQLASLGTLVEPPETAFADWSPFAEILPEAEVIITGWHTPQLTEAELGVAKRLRAVVHSGGSVRAVVPDVVYRDGVRVSSQTAANAEPVAEYTAAMVMLAAKDTFRAARLYANRRGPVDWAEDFPNAGLYGARVGFVGLSRISRRAIALLQGFNLDMLVYSRYLSDEEASALGVRAAGLEEIFSTCNVISLHSADVPKNYRMIGKELLALIPAGATFINTARGRLVDQDALIEQLRDGRFDAILDVADPDVTVPDSPLWDMPNVTLTPHYAGSLGREFQRLGEGVVTNVAEALTGAALTGEISADDYDKIA